MKTKEATLAAAVLLGTAAAAHAQQTAKPQDRKVMPNAAGRILGVSEPRRYVRPQPSAPAPSGAIPPIRFNIPPMGANIPPISTGGNYTGAPAGVAGPTITNPPYPYYGGGSTVIINNGGVVVSPNSGYYNPGYGFGYNGYGYGYNGGAQEVTVVDALPNGQVTTTTTTTTRPVVSVIPDSFIWGGYAARYAAGRTVVSPFSGYFGFPRYVQTRYVLSGYRYPYAAATEQAGDYWDSAPQSRATRLRAALGDIARFWQSGDGGALARHISPDLPVAVFEGSRYLYALQGSDLVTIAGDAASRFSTVSFRADRVRERSDGLVKVYATHTYRPQEGGAVRTASVEYTMVYLDGTWRVSALTLPA